MSKLSTNVRMALVGCGMFATMFICEAASTATQTPQMQHSETIVTNDDGSTSWHVQNEPVYEPTTPPITAPCMSCLIGHDNGPAINVGGGAPVPNAAACQQNPTMVGCPSR